MHYYTDARNMPIFPNERQSGFHQKRSFQGVMSQHQCRPKSKISSDHEIQGPF